MAPPEDESSDSPSPPPDEDWVAPASQKRLKLTPPAHEDDDWLPPRAQRPRRNSAAAAVVAMAAVGSGVPMWETPSGGEVGPAGLARPVASPTKIPRGPRGPYKPYKSPVKKPQLHKPPVLGAGLLKQMLTAVVGPAGNSSAGAVAGSVGLSTSPCAGSVNSGSPGSSGSLPYLPLTTMDPMVITRYRGVPYRHLFTKVPDSSRPTPCCPFCSVPVKAAQLSDHYRSSHKLHKVKQCKACGKSLGARPSRPLNHTACVFAMLSEPKVSAEDFPEFCSEFRQKSISKSNRAELLREVPALDGFVGLSLHGITRRRCPLCSLSVFSPEMVAHLAGSHGRRRCRSCSVLIPLADVDKHRCGNIQPGEQQVALYTEPGDAMLYSAVEDPTGGDFGSGGYDWSPGWPVAGTSTGDGGRPAGEEDVADHDSMSVKVEPDDGMVYYDDTPVEGDRDAGNIEIGGAWSEPAKEITLAGLLQKGSEPPQPKDITLSNLLQADGEAASTKSLTLSNLLEGFGHAPEYNSSLSGLLRGSSEHKTEPSATAEKNSTIHVSITSAADGSSQSCEADGQKGAKSPVQTKMADVPLPTAEPGLLADRGAAGTSAVSQLLLPGPAEAPVRASLLLEEQGPPEATPGGSGGAGQGEDSVSLADATNSQSVLRHMLENMRRHLE